MRDFGTQNELQLKLTAEDAELLDEIHRRLRFAAANTESAHTMRSNAECSALTRWSW